MKVLESESPIISIKGLATRIDHRYIHKDLDLTIRRGEILAIVGGSGSGKTTLLRAMLGLQAVAGGTITLLGHDVTHSDARELENVRKNCGVLFQHGALFSSLTVLDNVIFPLQELSRLDKQTQEEIALLKLSLVGLSPDAAYKYPAELSGGMIKRAALARAIVMDPCLLFLDEPTAGLDPQGASGLDELIFDLKASLGLTIIMVTHDLDTLWRVTDRVAFLGEGKVLQVDPMEKLVASSHTLIHNYFSDPRSQAARHIREFVTPLGEEE